MEGEIAHFIFGKSSTELASELTQMLEPFLCDPNCELYKHLVSISKVKIVPTGNEISKGFSFIGDFTALVHANGLIIDFLKQTRDNINNVLAKTTTTPHSEDKLLVNETSASVKFIKEKTNRPSHTSFVRNQKDFPSPQCEGSINSQHELSSRPTVNEITDSTSITKEDQSHVADRQTDLPRLQEPIEHSSSDLQHEPSYQFSIKEETTSTKISIEGISSPSYVTCVEKAKVPTVKPIEDSSEESCPSSSAMLCDIEEMSPINGKNISEPLEVKKKSKKCHKNKKEIANDDQSEKTTKVYSLRKSKPAHWFKQLLNSHTEDNEDDEVLEDEVLDSEEEYKPDKELIEDSSDSESLKESDMESENDNKKKENTNKCIKEDELKDVSKRFTEVISRKKLKSQETKTKRIQFNDIDFEHPDVDADPDDFELTQEVYNGKKEHIGKITRCENDPKIATSECLFCRFRNTSEFPIARRQLQSHHRRVHFKRDLNFKCEICDKKFGTAGDLHLHKLSRHVYKKCEDCGKLIQRRSFPQHARRHNPDFDRYRFECDICHKKFTTKVSMKTHLSNVHSLGEQEPAVACKICCKVFSRKTQLDKHVKSVHEKTEKVCEYCGKKVSSKSFKEHHCNDKVKLPPQFICSVCSKAFRFRAGLNTHMKTHSDQRDYTCSTCGKTFTQLSSIKRHMLQHTGERPYVCSICQKSFNDRSILRRHRILKHKIHN